MLAKGVEAELLDSWDIVGTDRKKFVGRGLEVTYNIEKYTPPKAINRPRMDAEGAAWCKLEG
eukprot:8832225-Lingulodinium_polyedra.AAC.1